MEIVAIQESFIDYPEHLSLVFFVKKCPWNCINCHNKLNLGELEVISMDSVRDYIVSSKPLFNHFVISGGEPTYYDDLPNFIEFLKIDGFAKVKLDTNGFNSKMLKKVLPLLDAVSMDIKASFTSTNFGIYDEIARVKVNPREIISSIKLLSEFCESGKYVEFRTTLLDDLINVQEVINSVKGVLNGNLGKITYKVNDEIIKKL